MLIIFFFPASIAADFCEIVNSNRVNCRHRRNEWLVPVYQGMERRVRSRQSQEQRTSRAASNVEGDELVRLQQEGLQALQRYRDSIVDPVTVHSQNGVALPEIRSRPEEMPPLPMPQDVLADSIQREASVCNSLCLRCSRFPKSFKYGWIRKTVLFSRGSSCYQADIVRG